MRIIGLVLALATAAAGTWTGFGGTGRRLRRGARRARDRRLYVGGVTGAVADRTAAPTTGTLTAVDADGDALVFSLLSQPATGTVAITDAATGASTFAPNAGAIGSSSFTFAASDGLQTSAPARP